VKERKIEISYLVDIVIKVKKYIFVHLLITKYRAALFFTSILIETKAIPKSIFSIEIYMFLPVHIIKRRNL